jgi:hypothetical protein
MKIGRCLVTAIAAMMLIATALGKASAQTVQLSGSVSPDALKLPTFGDLPATQTLQLQIWFKPRNQAQLNKLLADQRDPIVADATRLHQAFRRDAAGLRQGRTLAHQ